MWLGHLVNNYIWLKLDINYLTYDAHRHFLMSLRIFDAYQDFSFHILANFIQATQLHPPLVGIFTAPFHFLFGISQDIGVMVNAAIFLAILIFSTYKLGEKLTSKKAGLLAAFLVSIYPVIFNQLKVYMLDLPLTALVTLTVYSLLMAEYFYNLKYSILFGISFGLGMLTKQTFPLFIIGPLSYIIIRNISSFRASKFNNFKQWIINLILSLTLAFLVCFPYYFEKIHIVLDKAKFRWTTTWPTPIPESSLFLHIFRSFLWYLWGFINWQISFFYFLIFLIGVFFFSQAQFKNKSLLYLWILVPWILVSCFRYTIGFNMEVTGIRYTLPVLPAAALITATGIMQIPIKKIRFFSIIAIVIFGILQLLFISYPIFNNLSFKEITLPVYLPGDIQKYRILPERFVILNLKSWAVSGSDSGSHPQDMRHYLRANEEIFKIIDSSKGDKENISLFIIPDDTRLWHLQYKSYIEKRPFQVFCDWNSLRWDMMKTRKNLIPDLVSTSDYIIDKEGGWQGESYVQHVVTKARDYFYQHKDKFTLLAKVRWPDKSNILIFKRNITND